MEPKFSLNELSDRQEILDLIAKYCRAIDRADYVAVRAVYAHDGTDLHTGFDGSADEYVAWVESRTSSFTGTMHTIGTHLAEIQGDRAFAETYGTAHHWGEPSNDPTLNFNSGFRYLDTLRRDPDGWRIVSRIAVREWTQITAGLLTRPEGSGAVGVRGPSDPYFEARARAFTVSLG